MSETTDRLLGGRVVLRQPRDGLRAAIDPVLLAAGVPARPGEQVLEAGCGTGAAFLCLAARIPGVRVRAIERDTGLAALAELNAAANGLAGRVALVCGDIADPALARGGGVAAAHGFANPPWWPDGTLPPDPRRRAATHADAAGLADWARFLAAGVVPGGSVSLLLPAALADAGLAALAAAGCGAPLLLPFWPRAGQPARRVLLRGRVGRTGPMVVHPGLVLHQAGADYTVAAEAVLRDAVPLDA